MKNEEAIEALRISGLADGLDEKDLAHLLASSRVRSRRLGRGELVFRDGDMPKELYILLTGEVHIRKDTFAGRSIFVSEIEAAGDLFGEIYMILQKPYDIYVEAQEESEILAISSDYFTMEAGETSTALLVQRNLMRIFARKAYFMHTRIKILASGSLRERIARFLFHGMKKDGTVTLGVTREYMAAYLAATRPSLSRELSAMQRDGLITLDGRGITIADKDAFEAYL